MGAAEVFEETMALDEGGLVGVDEFRHKTLQSQREDFGDEPLSSWE